jgi:2,3-bisphosphoglycerate-dependent phosphoglycerate mutase
MTPAGYQFSMLHTHTQICLVRHGETDWNAQHRLQGHEDIPLNARGLAQADALADELRSCSFAAIYHSDLQRATSTARAVAAERGIPMIAEPSLRERHFGDIQGLTRNEAEQRFPGVYPRIRAREPFEQPPGNGESLNAFAQRIGRIFSSIAANHLGQQILIVSHGGCMDIMYRIVTGKPLTEVRDFPLGNATLNWVQWQNGSWKLCAWDEKKHLQNCLDEISL